MNGFAGNDADEVLAMAWAALGPYREKATGSGS